VFGHRAAHRIGVILGVVDDGAEEAFDLALGAGLVSLAGLAEMVGEVAHIAHGGGDAEDGVDALFGGLGERSAGKAEEREGAKGGGERLHAKASPNPWELGHTASLLADPG